MIAMLSHTNAEKSLVASLIRTALSVDVAMMANGLTTSYAVEDYERDHECDAECDQLPKSARDKYRFVLLHVGSPSSPNTVTTHGDRQWQKSTRF